MVARRKPARAGRQWAPVKPTVTVRLCSVAGCDRYANHGVGFFPLRGQMGTWYCGAHWATSEHGVVEALERQQEAMEGVDDE